MGTDSKTKDELAVTATAEVASAKTEPGVPPGDGPPTELGRYRIEGVLGVGGMGVVYRAFDPDLERHVALKVLAEARRDVEARERLLREARAMARLNHPHVITVFEVGSVGGRDYVAMELVDGGTLVDWVRAGTHSTREIVGAFLQAGHGLAAAHAAGLIHRDFKPHNVLRWNDGSVEVTDFGLAREVGAPAATDGPPQRNTPTPLDGMTRTGAIMGTPAYMAPEQWRGELVGPAADQFAFCVALWEALAGARPYGGEVDAMRAAAEHGPEDLDASAIPRNLRELLRRGLQPDPAKRWPDMTAVLHRLERAQRQSGLVFALGGATATTVAAIAILLARGGAGETCRAPLAAPAAAVPFARLVMLRAHHQEPAARALERDAAAWIGERDRACKAEPELRVKQLACLDGVVGRMDAAAYAAEQTPVAHDDVSQFLVDPALCGRDAPPRLVPTVSAAWRAVMVRALGERENPEPFDRKVADRLIAAANGEPCGAAIAHLYAVFIDDAVAARRAELEQAANLANQCDDDRLRFTVATAAAGSESDELGADNFRASLQRAETALQRVTQPDTTADVDMLRERVAAYAGRSDEAIVLAEHAVEGYRVRGRTVTMMSAAVALINLHQVRATKADIAANRTLLDQLYAVGVAELGADDADVAKIGYLRAQAMYFAGDLAGAHAIYDRLRRAEPIAGPVRVRGRVVDATGSPVAGANVTTGCCFEGDALAAAVALDAGQMRTVTTGADGRFELAESVSKGMIIADRGALRSRPTDIAAEANLVLEPTSRIDGTIALGDLAATNVAVHVVDLSLPGTSSYRLVAPVHPDGTYSISGVPRGRVRIDAAATRSTTSTFDAKLIEVHDEIVRGVDFTLASPERTMHVIVRSTSNDVPGKALVYVFAGKIASTNVRDLVNVATRATSLWASPLQGEHAPKPVLARALAGDLVATDEHAPAGEASACAELMPDGTNRTLWEKAGKHPEKIAVPCVPIGANDEVVVVEVPPFPRFD